VRLLQLSGSAVDHPSPACCPRCTQAAEDRREFQLPDANKDGKITRAEFNAYITEYLKQSPGLTRADMPRFEDFDFSKDGTVSFAEWQRYLDQQRLEDLAATANAAGKSVAKTYSSNVSALQ
jgi:EF hand